VPSEHLKAKDLKQVMYRYLARLREYRDALNRLNVYPVPDGDTGTNMTLTVESVVAEVDGAENMAELTAAMARGSLMGAQGNSGIILSQILRGLADTFRNLGEIQTEQLVEALDRASDAAYRAVGRPVEGTILTVLRRAAEAASETETPGGESLGNLLSRVYVRAEQALRETPELLPVLKEAGVVDAGGAGFLLLLVAFLEEVTGEPVAVPETIFTAATQMAHSTEGDGHAAEGIAGLRYEVMFLLDGEDGAGDRLRQVWRDCGDSIVVVGGDGRWNCHIHTNDIAPAIEAGIALGRPHRLQITDLLQQVEEECRYLQEFTPLPEVVDAKVGLVAVATGSGVVDLFRTYGAQGVVVGGQTMNPSVGELLEVVEAVPASAVVVLPNNRNVIPAANELNALTRKDVYVVPTRSVPEGIAAVVGYSASEVADKLVADMTRAAEAVHAGEMTRAVRDATTPAGSIREGDWLGLVDGEVQVIRRAVPSRVVGFWLGMQRLLVGRRRAERQRSRCVDSLFGKALVGLLDRVVAPDAEVATLVAGAGANDRVTETARRWFRRRRPRVELDIIHGGQPLYPYLIGVE
jgi:DAK2 domain fusion protein YloV